MTNPTVRNTTAILPNDSNHLLMAAANAREMRQTMSDANRCRFDMFVRLRPGMPSKFKDQKRTWCYRGDKFTDQEHKMLRNLITMITKDHNTYDVIELYDNTKPPLQRIVVKLQDGVVVANNLAMYADLLINYPLPLWLKS